MLTEALGDWLFSGKAIGNHFVSDRYNEQRLQMSCPVPFKMPSAFFRYRAFTIRKKST